MNLRMKSGIAGAVAREILAGQSEGLAYKAEFDRQGSNALKHCDAFAADCGAMEFLTRSQAGIRGMSHGAFALLESSRGRA